MNSLLKYSTAYLIARVLPGMVNFLTIPIYTRLLSPAEYGAYVLVVAAAGFGNVVLFDWVRQSLLRYLPAHLSNVQSFLGNILAVFLVCAGVFGGLFAILAPFVFSTVPKTLVLVGIVLMLTTAWFELNLELARSLLKPLVFGVMLGVRAFVALAVGVALVRVFGLSTLAPLIGLILGMLLATLSWGRSQWKGVRLRFDSTTLREMLRYGLPLTISLLFTFVIGLSDRFLISYYLGVDQAGAYAATYDFVQQTVAYVMSSISMAVYPLVIRSVESEGQEFATQQAQRALSLLVAASIPIVAVLLLFSRGIARIFLGKEFQEAATVLIPWLAVSMFISGVRAYYYDMAFQISRKTTWHAATLGVAALVNVLLNVWWLPRYGVVAAGYATLASLFVALLCSIIWGRQFVRLRVCWSDVLKVGASLLVAVALCLLLPRSQPSSMAWLGVQIAVCLVAYAVVLVLVNAGNARNLVRPLVWRRREM